LPQKGKGRGSCHKREKGKPLATKGKRENPAHEISGSLRLGNGHRAHARTKRNDFPVGEALAALSPPNLRFAGNMPPLKKQALAFASVLDIKPREGNVGAQV